MLVKLITWAKSQDWIFSSQYLREEFSHTYAPMSEQYKKKKEILYLFKKEGLHSTITCNKNLSEWDSLSCLGLFATPWTVACQAPPSMEFSRQEYWSALPFPSPWYLPNPGIEPGSPTLQAVSLPSELPGKLCCTKRMCNHSILSSFIMFMCQ